MTIRSTTSGVYAPTRTGLSNGWIAVLFFIGCEAVLFGSLVSAYIFLRVRGSVWPPVGFPRLDPMLPALYLIILLASGAMAFGAELSMERFRIVLAERLLLVASVLGVIFVGGQVYEFGNLLSHGITVSNSIYGSLFYTMIGFHGFHVVSGIAWLLSVWSWTRQAKQTPEDHFAVKAATLYWSFVAIVWIVFYLLLYVV